MRTKTNERKRYSLRVSRIRSNEQKCDEDALVEKKPKVENRPQTDTQQSSVTPIKKISVSNKTSKSQKTKRKGKPSKAATKTDEQTEVVVEKVVTVESVINPPPIATEENVVQDLEEVSTSKEDGKELPVYTALEHAVMCHDEENICVFPKCSIAKQFIAHSETCPKKENCTICKAMEIMVCKHAENCETPLEKCCPIPNCDRVRYIVLEEWVKLKHRHHDIMSQVFQGLMHAWKCHSEACKSILCENIKTVLRHTHSCPKDNKACRTKNFIWQLCEYHQRSCQDQQCTVEFCQENRRRKQNELEVKNNEKHPAVSKDKVLKSAEEELYALGAAKPIQNLTANNFFLPNVPPGGMPNMIPPWNITFPQQNGGCFPQNQFAYSFPYMSWQPFNSGGFTMNPLQQPQEQNSNVMERKEEDSSTWPHSNLSQVDNKDFVDSEDQASCLPESQEQITDPNDFRMIQEMSDVNNTNTFHSQSDEMYYQLWPTTKHNEAKTSLPALSPNELQTILSREEDMQMLSPVQNNRAQFSEAPIIMNEYQPSQESELDENPIAVGQSPSSSTRHHVVNEGQFNSCVPEVKTVKNIQDSMKDQETWSKIDFVKEKRINQQYAVESQVMHQTDNESQYSEIPDGDYFISKDEEEDQVTREEGDQRQMTQIEKSYLNLLQSQKHD